MASEQISLFGDDVGSSEPESRGLTLSSRRGRALTKAQRAFNRLVGEVEELRSKIERESRRLDDTLAYYAQHLHPRLRRRTELRKEYVRALAVSLDGKCLKGKRDRATLREVIAAELEELHFEEGSLADDDLRALFERLHGRGFEEVEEEEMAEARQEIESMLNDFGIKLDLSEFKPGVSDETLAAKAAEIAGHVREAEENWRGSNRPRRQTQRQMQKEEQLRQAEELRKKTVASLYKQLARVLHPDLELDAALKEQKQALMQELTVAYRNNDMHTLLRLELEWIAREEGNLERLSDEKLALYNQTLKEQVADLQRELYELPCHPRYQPIAEFDGPFGVSIRDNGPAEARALDEGIANIEASIRDLRSKSGVETLKAISHAYREEQRAIKKDFRRFRF
jgi:hypothetical protein